MDTKEGDPPKASEGIPSMAAAFETRRQQQQVNPDAPAVGGSQPACAGLPQQWAPTALGWQD